MRFGAQKGDKIAIIPLIISRKSVIICITIVCIHINCLYGFFRPFQPILFTFYAEMYMLAPFWQW